MKSYKLTKKQVEKLQERLRQLEEVEIPKNIEKIEVAKDFGDLSENAEYHSAKEQQALLLNELSSIEDRLNRAVIIEEQKTFDQVDIGHTVTVKLLNENKELTFTLIGEDGNGVDEVDVNSKLGKSVLGKSIGDEFSYEANDPNLSELKFVLLEIN